MSMKVSLSKWLFSFTFLLLTGCSPEGVYRNSQLTRIDVGEDALQAGSIFDFIEDFRYVKLETTSASLISQIHKVLCKHDKLYLLDISSAVLFVFDINGTFLFKIDSQGPGPSEYRQAMDFDVDGDGRIYIVDPITKNVLRYSPDGKYLDAFSQQSYTRNIAVLDNSIYLTYLPTTFSSDFDNTLVVRNEETVVHSYMRSVGKSDELISLKANALCRSSSILFNRDLSDTIFEVDIKGATPKYMLDFGAYSIKPQDRYNKKAFTIGLPNIKEGYSINNFYETADYFTCSFNLKSKSWSLYYGKESGRYVFFDCAGCGQANLEILGPMNARAVAGNEFISIVPASYFLEYKERFLGERADRLREMLGQENTTFIEEFHPEENPVLVFYSLNGL